MRLAMGMCALACLAGCAGTSFRPVSAKGDAKDTGIRYYESAPFLLVYSNGRGGITSEIKFLPDVTNKRSVDPFAVLAQNDTTLTFADGTLTQSKTVVDETGVPKAIVTALEKVASAAIAAANAPGDEPTEADFPLPRLYKIVITAEQVSLEGGKVIGADGKELHSIRAVISAQASLDAAAKAPDITETKPDAKPPATQETGK